MAVADTMLQRDTPLPARLTHRGPCEGRQGTAGFTGDGNRPVTGQPATPVVVAGFKRLFDQHAAKAGAVDKKVCRDPAVSVQVQIFDKTRFRMAGCMTDLAFGPDDAVGFGIAPQEQGVSRRIELVRPAEARLDRARVLRRVLEASLFRRQDGVRPFVQAGGFAQGPQSEPRLVEWDAVDRLPVVAERMDITIAGPAPVTELDTQLEGRFGRLHEGRFVDVQGFIEFPDMRQRGFADADRADFIGFDQLDLDRQPPQLVGEGCRGHPTRRAAAQNADFFYMVRRLRHPKIPN